MQISEQDGGDQQAAPRSGAPALAAPLLVNNPPNAEQEASERTKWTEQQWKIRRVCVDRLRYWQSHGHEVLWVTLTSGVPVPGVLDDRAHKLLRVHFRELLRRVKDWWRVDAIEYVCVETLEGNGVLHMLWAAKADKGEFYIPYEWLSESWAEIHGAWNVWVARVRQGKSSLHRLSRYIVSQYCGGQDGLVRLSQSRMGQPFGKMRKALLAAMRACTARFEYYKRLQPELWHVTRFGRVCNQWYWLEFRHAWDDLVLHGMCEFFGQVVEWRQYCGNEDEGDKEGLGKGLVWGLCEVRPV